MRIGYRVFSLTTSLLFLSACPLDDGGAGDDDTTRVELRRDQTVLVCVTATAPADLSDAALDDVYLQWQELGVEHSELTSTALFDFELDDPESPRRLMFALFLDDDPSGMPAAQAFRADQYARFKGILDAAGFTSVSKQSNLTYIDGADYDLDRLVEGPYAP